MKFIIGVFLTLILSTSVHFAQDSSYIKSPELSELFEIKETYTYEVTYGPFKLGWVDVIVHPDTMYNGRMHHYIQTNMRSNRRSPFIGKEIDHFHSLFYENEDGIPVTSKFWKDDIDDNDFEEIVHIYDREHGLVYMDGKGEKLDTLTLVEPASSGHIIFHFSRIFAGTDQDSRLNVYINQDLGYINFSNPSSVERRKYKPFDEPIMAHLTFGETVDMTGPFGFSGKFRAWFLNDKYRTPLEARVKVLFGNAIIKLIEYKQEPV